MAEIDLNFIGSQLQRLIDDLADLRADVRMSKDDMNVLTAIVLRLEGTVTRHDQRLDRVVDRLRKLEEAR